MVGSCRGMGFLPRSVALRRICRILRRALFTTGCRQKLGEGVHRILEPLAPAYSGKEQVRYSSQRRRPAVDGTAPDFSANRERLSERNLSQGRLRSTDRKSAVWGKPDE